MPPAALGDTDAQQVVQCRRLLQSTYLIDARIVAMKFILLVIVDPVKGCPANSSMCFVGRSDRIAAQR